MTSADSVFHEVAADRRVASVPLSHLSIELGHLYLDDFAAGLDLEQYFEQVAPWVNAGRQACVGRLQGRKGQYGQQGREARARVSTCFLVDDYFMRFSSPAKIVPQLVNAAQVAGLEIDYLVRESGCAATDDVALARSVEARLVPDPPSNTNGSRPHATEVGWLCNGQRSPANVTVEAMDTVRPWVPPVENAFRRHSIFLDVELWDESDGRRTWSCPFLASVWQLLRLGMLRHNGEDVVAAQKWRGAFPEDWGEIPVVTQLNPTAAPFSAYQTLSILSTQFLPIEHAVRAILSQVAINRDVLSQVMIRSRNEGMELPLELIDRIEYVFTGNSASQSH